MKTSGRILLSADVVLRKKKKKSWKEETTVPHLLCFWNAVEWISKSLLSFLKPYPIYLLLALQVAL